MQVGIFDNLQNGKTVPVTQAMVQEAYRCVKKKAQRVYKNSERSEKRKKSLKDDLYILWNRLASGSYYPPPVREVSIPKARGKGERKLGIAPLTDKVGQMVIKQLIEPRFEELFTPSSYGYRPGRSAREALGEVRKNCWKYDWVVDLDIKGFFDEIDHELLMRAVSKSVKEKWIQMYIQRWLEAPIEDTEGKKRNREGKGTPQGGILSPLLANIYLHYSLDKWLSNNHPTIKFVRYADDIVIHCKSEAEAEELLRAVRKRLSECKLRVNEEKTKIVYCKDGKRKERYGVCKFDFLGYSFQPRRIYHPTYKVNVGFLPAISQQSISKILHKIRETKELRKTEVNLARIASVLNEQLRGWIKYYSYYRGYQLKKVFRGLDERLKKWLQKKYKGLKGSARRAMQMLKNIYKSMPYLFEHWRQGYSDVCH